MTVTVQPLSQSYPIVDADGNPATHFVQAWTNLRRQVLVFTPTTGGTVPLSGGGAVTFLRADGTWAAPAGSGSGTVTSASVTTANGVSGTVATPTTTPAITLTLGAITPTSVAATGTVTGSNFAGTHSGTSSGTNTGDQTITLTGNVTGTGTSSFATTIAASAVTRAMMAATAGATILGSTAAGAVAELTAAQSTALLNNFTATLAGHAPLSGGGTTNFLRADGTWAAPVGGSGTVTSVSVTTANGVSGTVATATTTPAITFTLGAITPTTIVATGAVSGTNLSGTNTGDQTTVSGNAGTATALQTARTINGVSFNGTANITVPAGFTFVSKTASYTETTTNADIYISANLAAGFTITLPTAVGNTARYTIKKALAAGQIIIATTSAQLIDGGATATLNNQWETVTILSDNANWMVV